MAKTPILYIVLLITLIIPGCIREDMDDCPKTLYSLFFDYKGDGTKEIFLDKIKNVNLYVYDENEQYLKTIAINQNDLLQKQGIDLNLSAGKYHIVCWGNTSENSEVKRGTSIDDSYIGAPEFFSQTTITTNDSLYFGSRDIVIPERISAIDTVYFKGTHIGFTLVVDNLDMGLFDKKSTKSETVPQLRIEVANLSPTVNFRGICSSTKVSYFPKVNLEVTKEEIKATFNVLRFNNNNDVIIRLRNIKTNEIIHSLFVKQFMEKFNISVDNKNEVDIGIRFRFNGPNIVVKPWEEEIIVPGN